jgi:hypothetical protein
MQNLKPGDKVRYKGGCPKSDHVSEKDKFGEKCFCFDDWTLVTEPELTLDNLLDEADEICKKDYNSQEFYEATRSLIDKYRPATKYTVKEAEDKLTKLEGKNVKIV